MIQSKRTSCIYNHGLSNWFGPRPVNTQLIGIGHISRLDADLLAIVHEAHFQAAPLIVFRDKPQGGGVGFMIFPRVFQKGVRAIGKAFADIVLTDRRRFQREF